LLTACNSPTDPSGQLLDSNVVTNPNTAKGKADRKHLPEITFEETEHDFGRLIDGETVAFNFSFTNTGKTDLVIADVSSSCGCTVPSYPRQAIRPGDKGSIKVSFNSRGRRGFQSKTVVVVANTQPNVIQLRIKAQVIAPGAE
jgi:hypothetical protein